MGNDCDKYLLHWQKTKNLKDYPNEILCEGYRIILDERFFQLKDFQLIWTNLPNPIKPSFEVDLEHYSEEEAIEKIKLLTECEAKEWAFIKIPKKEKSWENVLFKEGFNNLIINTNFYDYDFDKVLRRIKSKWGNRAFIICSNFQIEDINLLSENVENVDGIELIDDLNHKKDTFLSEAVIAYNSLPEFGRIKIFGVGDFESSLDIFKMFRAGCSYVLDKNYLYHNSAFNKTKYFSLSDILLMLWTDLKTYTYFSGKDKLEDIIGQQDFIRKWS